MLVYQKRGAFMKCACGLDKEYNECCGAIINGNKNALSPQELMRSRYSAYVKSNGKYLVFSAVKENRYDEDVGLIEEFSNSVQWLKLNILSAADDTVEFKAYYREKAGLKVLHEKSKFKKEDGLWRYVDGILYNSKIERNEICPCGSGKKYKKCCG